MGFTSADLAASQGAYLTAQADPRTAPGLDFIPGTVVVWGTTLLQKRSESATDWSEIGGTPIVTADPVAPEVNTQWILHAPEVPATPAEFTIDVEVASSAALPPVDVIWSHLTNLAAAGSSLTDTSGGGWDAIAWSDQLLAGDGFVEVVHNHATQGGMMFGVSSAPAVTAPTFDTLDFCVADQLAAEIAIFNNGVLFDYGPPVSWTGGADTIRIERLGLTFNYYLNGVRFATQVGTAVDMKPALAGFGLGVLNTSAALGTVPTTLRIVSPIDGGSPFVGQAGVDWVPGAGGSTPLDAAAIAGYINSLADWSAHAVGSLITATHDVPGADPGLSVSFSGPGTFTPVIVSLGTDTVDEKYTYKIRGATGTKVLAQTT